MEAEVLTFKEHSHKIEAMALEENPEGKEAIVEWQGTP
jgi:hypothetical protein